MTIRDRYWEIDLLRGLAIIGMISYHLYFDLYFFLHINLSFIEPLFFVVGKLTAITFLFLVGFSFYLSKGKNNSHFRSLKIFLAASLVSFITYLVNPDLFVRFGILHLIALSLLLLIPLSFIKSRILLLAISLAIIISGFIFNTLPKYDTFDYYPVFPWFGITLLGFISASFYLSHRPQFFLKPHSTFFDSIIFMGRHSLLIYLLHQPLLFFLLIPFR